MRDAWKGVLGLVLVIATVVIVIFFGLDAIFQMVMTEVIGWSVLSAVVLPGSLVTAAIDQLTPLDRAQLWTWSIVFTGVIFVVFVTLLARLTGTPDVLFWYGVLVGSLLLLTAVLFFGFKVRWIGTFLSRFAFGPELFNPDLWMPVIIQLVVASWMALAGTAVVALGWTASMAFSRVQLWMLAIVLNGVAAAVLVAWRRRRRLNFERFVIGYFLVGVINVLATIVGCVLYFGFRVTVLAAAFSQFAPQWPDWFD